MKNEYIIVSKTSIQKRIDDLERWNYMQEGATTYRSPMHYESSRRLIIQNKEVILELKQILSQSTPLIPEIEKAFDSSWFKAHGVMANKEKEKENYISNLKLNI